MQATYFKKFFNLCALLFPTAILSIVCTIFLSFIVNSLQGVTYLKFVYRLTSIFFWASLSTSLISSIIFILLFSIEIKSRKRKDRLSNLWKSIKQTLAIRIFLHQSEHSKAITTTEQTTTTYYNPINKQFNKAVHKSIIDVRRDTIILMIRIPKTQQATKILKEMETLISEEISNRNPDYYFSQPERNGKWLSFVGTKRK